MQLHTLKASSREIYSTQKPSLFYLCCSRYTTQPFSFP